MPLSPGTRLGHYDVTALIGEGGMGQVWQATDTQLNRQVALKILPDAFAADPDRLARFQREAQVLASLNHPNIAQIHGIETSDDTQALVLELVEGPTLADRIAKGPIPVDEALPIAKQIAEALEAAHEAGVIHRDLKPANIKVRDDGAVKVLDFGLAKALDSTPDGDPSQSPTLTAAATQMGVIMGTAAYMSPEQARGKTVDKRADIWAFGAVLFEMLTGKRAFEGEDISVTLADVIRADVSWDALPSSLPPPLGALLSRCLAKDPRQRVRDIGDVRLTLDGAFDTATGVVTDGSPARHAPPRWQRPLPVVVAVLAALGAGALGAWNLPRRPEAPDLVRLTLVPPETAPLSVDTFWPDIVLSPDGTRVVYGSTGTRGRHLVVRPLDRRTGAPLLLGDGGEFPFVSRTGEWVGFVENDQTLKKVSVSGGSAVTLTESAFRIIGATWRSDDEIVFGAGGGGLFRVSGGGGAPEALTSVDPGQPGSGHVWPFVIPDRDAVLFAVQEVFGAPLQLAALDLETTEVTRLGLEGSRPHYVSTGHLVYNSADGALRAVRFDATALEVIGDPVTLIEDVTMKTFGTANFSVSDAGRLIYTVGSGAVARGSLAWVDRDGREEVLLAPARNYDRPRVSPTGTSVAVDIRGGENPGVWVYDLARETLSKLTTGSDPTELAPVWAADGERLAFVSAAEQISARRADGTGAVEPLYSRMTGWSGPYFAPYAWSSDGAFLVFMDERGGSVDIGMVTMDGSATTTWLLDTPFDEGAPAVSPDGRWLAYHSRESGQQEVYVRPFPGLGARQQISPAGGREPVWSRDGTELFYRNGDQMLRVPIASPDRLDPGAPELLFEAHYRWGDSRGLGLSYDISADGQRFLMIKEEVDGGEADHIRVVLNWGEELKARVP